MTRAYPIVEFKPRTWEIDEFDCASVYVLEGSERALVIDAGIGIGDLRGAIEQLTDKPLTLVLTHGHGDHIGACCQFEACFLSERDWGCYEFPEDLARRRQYAASIARRERGEHPDYPYDPETDIVPWTGTPRRLPLVDGQTFDLGGRMVTAMACPGHTPGQMMFLDEGSRTLFVGDALNCNLFMNSKPGEPNFVSIERAAKGLETMAALLDSGRIDAIYNGHHDFRPVGEPLDPDVLPDALALCRQLLTGDFRPVWEKAPMPGWPDHLAIRRGRTTIGYSLEGIQEPKE